MTKRHFIALADVLRRNYPRPAIDTRPGWIVESGALDGALIEWTRLRDTLADFCASQNPRFDRARWLAYIAGECGPSGGKR